MTASDDASFIPTKLDVNNILLILLLLLQSLLVKLVNRCERAEVRRQFFAHISLLVVGFKITHHHFEHILLLLVEFDLVFQDSGMQLEVGDAILVHFEFVLHFPSCQQPFGRISRRPQSVRRCPRSQSGPIFPGGRRQTPKVSSRATNLAIVLSSSCRLKIIWLMSLSKVMTML